LLHLLRNAYGTWASRLNAVQQFPRLALAFIAREVRGELSCTLVFDPAARLGMGFVVPLCQAHHRSAQQTDKPSTS